MLSRTVMVLKAAEEQRVMFDTNYTGVAWPAQIEWRDNSRNSNTHAHACKYVIRVSWAAEGHLV